MRARARLRSHRYAESRYLKNIGWKQSLWNAEPGKVFFVNEYKWEKEGCGLYTGIVIKR